MCPLVSAVLARGVCAEIPLFFYVAKIAAAKMLLFFRKLAAMDILTKRVYQTTGEGALVFHEAPAPGNQQLPALLDKIINRILKLLTCLGHLIEAAGITYMARTESSDPDNVLTPLQAASSTYRIAMGPRAGRKVLSLQHAPRRVAPVRYPDRISILMRRVMILTSKPSSSAVVGARASRNTAVSPRRR